MKSIYGAYKTQKMAQEYAGNQAMKRWVKKERDTLYDDKEEAANTKEWEWMEVGGIVAHTFFAGPGRPVVFVLHGRTGKHKSSHPLCKNLQRAGFTAISVELRNHGSRCQDVRSNLTWEQNISSLSITAIKNKTHAIDMYSQCVGTAQDAMLLIDTLPMKYPHISMENGIGVTGISQGGHTSLIMFMNEPRIDVCVALIGSGDYMKNMQVRYEKFSETHSDAWSKLVPPALEALVEKYDPACNADNAKDRPLKMINGAEDKLVPACCNEAFVEKLREANMYSGESESKLSLEVLDGVKHEVPPEMIKKGLEWFCTHLAKGEKAEKAS